MFKLVNTSCFGQVLSYMESIVILFLGGFYSDDIGYVARSCKRCPNGSFVAFDKTPGTRKQDCKSCPEGNSEAFHVIVIKCYYHMAVYHKDWELANLQISLAKRVNKAMIVANDTCLCGAIFVLFLEVPPGEQPEISHMKRRHNSSNRASPLTGLI